MVLRHHGLCANGATSELGKGGAFPLCVDAEHLVVEDLEIEGNAMSDDATAALDGGEDGGSISFSEGRGATIAKFLQTEAIHGASLSGDGFLWLEMGVVDNSERPGIGLLLVIQADNGALEDL